jgi:hypothetical protein
VHVCFALAYPGYLRYFDTAIRELTNRGHAVSVFVHSPGKQPEGLRALDAVPGAQYRGELLRTRPSATATITRDLRRLADFFRYLHPEFRESRYYRRRTATHLPAAFGWMSKFETLPKPVVKAALRVLAAADAAAPRDDSFDHFITQTHADVLVISPLLMPGSSQPELARAAMAHGVPTVTAVASWDHLTTKGLLRPPTDKILIWNDAQRREALALHNVPQDRLVVTGAQAFDRWFERQPRHSAAQFRRHVGLPEGGPYVLFVGSTASISAPAEEVAFVLDWIRYIRAASPKLADLNVLIRPHPYNAEAWSEADLSTIPAAAVWPVGGSNPVDEADRDDYFDSLFYAAAVVGVNTSAMIEAAILDKPVLTIENGRFDDTQRGSLHFRHLLVENGGFLYTAADLAEHAAQLEQVLYGDDDALRAARRRFVESFLRPASSSVPPSVLFADAIESVSGGGRPAPPTPSPGRRIFSAVVIFLMSIQKAVVEPNHAPDLAAPHTRAVKKMAIGLRERGATASRQLKQNGRRRTARVVSTSSRRSSARMVQWSRDFQSALQRRAARTASSTMEESE